MSESKIEWELDLLMKEAGFPPWKREYRFHTTRHWQLDFAWKERMLAVECEGMGRHQTYAGFSEDCIKYNSAVLLGWRLLRFTGKQVHSGIATEMIREALLWDTTTAQTAEVGKSRTSTRPARPATAASAKSAAGSGAKTSSSAKKT